MSASEAVAAARIREAMKLVEEAQRLLDRAGESISPVRGFSREWSRVTKVYDQVRSCWYRLEYRLQRGCFDLDDAAKASLAGTALSDEAML